MPNHQNADRFVRVLRDLTRMHVPVVVSQNRTGKLVTVRTKAGTHVFTVGREYAIRAGLLKARRR
jgi:hypothetical protein